MKPSGRLVGLLVALALAGCDKPAESAPPPAMPKLDLGPVPNWPPTNAQPKLPVTRLLVGPQVVEAEVARRPVEVATGMMFRKQLGENEGMLFVLPTPQQASFYMKNTIVPLNVAYLDPRGTILELHELKPLDETPVTAKARNILFVLEMNKGWFTRNNITTGTVIRTESGGLKEAFRFAP